MNELEEILQKLLKFRDDRNWKQFHNSKDLALALSIEAAELNELFLWKRPEEANEDKIQEELADILIFAILLAHNYDLDIFEIIRKKIKINSQKYPVDKAKNNATKYKDL